MESEGHDNRITALAIMNSDELRSPVHHSVNIEVGVLCRVLKQFKI
jgi:hypothetical protein